MLEWLDGHAGGVTALATFVLVALTGYYAWTTRALVRESHTTLRAAARATLQARLDRIHELCIRDPELMARLNDASTTGDEEDARFFITGMFLSLLEEAHTQYHLEREMSANDWAAWVATADAILDRPYVTRYWARVANTYEAGFQRFVNERIRVCAANAPDRRPGKG